ncbi:MAG: hypothetical protein ACRD3O_09030 [Terriglobia bacterium]
MKALIKASWLAMLFVVFVLVRTTLVVAQRGEAATKVVSAGPVP